MKEIFMKKKFVLASALLMLAGVASAQIGVELKNSNDYVTHTGVDDWVDQVLVQLIWSNSDAAQASTDDADYLGFGEVLLNSLVTTAGWRGIFPDQSQGIREYTSAAYPGITDINDGYIFVRMFDNSALGFGDNYLQQYVQGPTLLSYDSFNPSANVYNTDTFIGGRALNDAEFGHQMVPEPAVISLIGIFGGGLLVAKRLFARS